MLTWPYTQSVYPHLLNEKVQCTGNTSGTVFYHKLFFICTTKYSSFPCSQMCGHKNFNCGVKLNFRIDCRTITEFWKPTMTLTTEDYGTTIFVPLHQCFPTFLHGGMVNNFHILRNPYLRKRLQLTTD